MEIYYQNKIKYQMPKYITNDTENFSDESDKEYFGEEDSDEEN